MTITDEVATMPGRAILHIGPMKTGTSSIQRWLRVHAASHAANGFFIPVESGANLSYIVQIVRARTRGEKLPAAIGSWWDKLTSEIANRPEPSSTVVLSGEMMGQRLRNPEDLATLRSLLDPMFDEYMIITYLRRQDEVAISLVSTALKQGRVTSGPLQRGVYYETMLAVWLDAFGREAMNVSLYRRDMLSGGDVVRDFAEVSGMPWVEFPGGTTSSNPSLKPPAQWLLEEVARRTGRSGTAESFSNMPGMARLRATLDRRYRGTGALPARDEAIAFFATFREENERVRRAWFPKLETLFEEDFSSYPEVGTPEPTETEKFEVALASLIAVVSGEEREVNPRRIMMQEAIARRRPKRQRSKRTTD